MNRLLVCGATVILLLAQAAPLTADDGLLARSWAGTVNGTKKVANFTVDAVTLKPVRNLFSSGKPSPKSWALGNKPDSRRPVRTSSTSSSKSSGGMWSWLKPKPAPAPKTVDEFLLLERPK